MDFVEIDIVCQEDLKDILTAELCQLGYESFLDTPGGFRAYQPVKNHDPDLVSKLLGRYTPGSSFKSRKLIDRNWNQVWEKTFEPIEIEGKCRIRASFHPPKSTIPIEIIIDPKMAFGTGHHETTRQVLQFQLNMDFAGKSVLDVGCGTGVLSILAEIKGASKILGLDPDPYAVKSTVENMVLNSCKKIKVKEGTIKDLKDNDPFDLILANINRNVLLDELGQYCKHLTPGGILILSGFYTYDSPSIVNKCMDYACRVTNQTSENHWACVVAEKAN